MIRLRITTKRLARPYQQLRAAVEQRLAGQEIQADVQPLGQRSAASAGPLLAVRVTQSRAYLTRFNPEIPNRPCPECLDRRLWSALTVAEQDAQRGGSQTIARSSPYLTGTVIDNIGALAQTIAGRADTGGAQRIWDYHLVSQQIFLHELLPDSFCTRCNSPESNHREDAVLSLRSTLQARSGKGRLRSLTEYRLPARALVNPICGAAGLHAIPGYAQSITAPVFGQYFQRGHDVGPRLVSWSGLCTRTDESRTAGMLESLERQAGMFAPPGRIAAIDSYANLQSDAMDPALCLGYNPHCYELPLGLTPFTDDLPLEWMWGYSLTREKPVLVPKQLVYYDRIAAEKTKVVDNCSSGCALGSCYEEAILRGLGELIERDSFVIAWHRGQSLPRLDPRSCRDRKTRHTLDRVAYLGYDITLLDGRLDLGIPSVIAIGRRRDRELGAMVVGASAGSDVDDAVRGALLEAATSIVEVPSMIRNKEAYVRSLAEDYYRVKSVSDHAMIYGLPHMADQVRWLDDSPCLLGIEEAYPADSPWHSEGDIAADLQRCLDELGRHGLHEVVVVDLTTREQRLFDLKTVRVIVPGLAPIDFGFPRHRVHGLPRLGGEARNPLPHPFP